MKSISTIFIVLMGSFCLLESCKNANDIPPYQLAAFTEEGINAVIEIPAGTNRKIEYNSEKQQYQVDILEGKKRIIDFLPYPGNYGFIPSTRMDKARGGDGDALDILVLGESQPTGTIMKVKPIALLELLDGGEIDTKIIGVPIDSALQIMKIEKFEDLLIKYNAVHRIIETWFLNYKGLGKMQLVGWKNEAAALAEIRKWANDKEVKN